MVRSLIAVGKILLILRFTQHKTVISSSLMTGKNSKMAHGQYTTRNVTQLLMEPIFSVREVGGEMRRQQLPVDNWEWGTDMA